MSARRKIPPPALPLLDPYRAYLAEVGEPVAAAILALGSTPKPDRREAREMLTPPQIGRQLGCAPETVIGWIESGALNASNLAKGIRPRWAVDPTDLAGFLESRQIQAPRRRGQPPAQPRTKNFRAWNGPTKPRLAS